MYNIGTNRELMWDMELAESFESIELKMHKPIRKNIALCCDAAWEGSSCGYISVIEFEGKIRIYYRGSGHSDQLPSTCICVAESENGKEFTKPKINRIEFGGSKENNIVFLGDGNTDNFAVYLDENPACPADAKFKALSQHSTPENHFAGLAYYKSADGLSFEFVRVLPIKGAFDSYNLTFWDKELGKYRLYFRDFHRKDGSDVPQGKHDEECIRDIRLTFSEDFESWSNPERITFTDGNENIQYYTSGINKYQRGNIFFGMPTRYIDRVAEKVNYKYLPTLGGIREELMRVEEVRSGTAITDCALIVSRDGKSFIRSEEAYLTPGIENGENWIYGDCYVSNKLYETTSDFPGEPNELSFLTGTGYRSRAVTFERFTLRLDGLYSWNAKSRGGSVLTKPICFEGTKMSVNFATSGQGSLRILLCDESGSELEGYDSSALFGNSVSRPVEFEKPLSALYKKTVRLKFEMKDCDLYSFVFEN